MTSDTEPKRCPRCNAKLDFCVNRLSRFKCETEMDDADYLDQSDRCRIAELEARIAKLEFENTALSRERDRMTWLTYHASVYQGKLMISGVNPYTDLRAAIDAARGA